MTTEEKLFRVRFKREGENYKTAVVNSEEKHDQNTAVDIMNKLKSQNIACWLFKDGQEGAVASFVPSNTEEIEL